ncbi:hypothetical protein BpHYR1_027809 [Brachionus plicatilis]|uniref:Uncharacterized protein n=1 Tax=Brachionus plicatilis TaxID=10195 RepID=A0A3M7P3I9_BRAPC|nr:hypothetical protein BpHYR1_027809 [Brachionus plicatilis]
MQLHRVVAAVLILSCSVQLVSSIRCLECFGVNCADTIYPASTRYVNCDEGVKFCLKLVYTNGIVNRQCSAPNLKRCCSNKRIRVNNRTAIQYCCNRNGKFLASKQWELINKLKSINCIRKMKKLRAKEKTVMFYRLYSKLFICKQNDLKFHNN